MKLVGRGRELGQLRSAWEAASEGKGSLLLISGETGVGKTSLARAGLEDFEGTTYYARANQAIVVPYGPLLTVLRDYLRNDPAGFSELGAFLPYLARVLPELGDAIEGDRATQDEALASAFRAMASKVPSAIILDDLQWADHATLEFIPSLALAIRSHALLVVGIYRNDHIEFDQEILRARADLRRAHLLDEIEVDPLEAHATSKLAEAVLGEPPAPDLASHLYDLTQGIPMYVEELCSALARHDVLEAGDEGLELREGEEVPLPTSVRAAALLSAQGLSAGGRELLQIAAVCGHSFDPDLVHALSEGAGDFEELIDHRLLVEGNPGELAFNNSLTRDAIYDDIGWSMRRELHKKIASLLAERGAPQRAVADHLLAGGELETAWKALLASAERSCELLAYQDAIVTYEKALEIWPEGRDEQTRLEALDSMGRCAELSGRPAEAIRTWERIATVRKERGESGKFAEVKRKIANAYEVQGSWEQANVARLEAADDFAESGLPGEAATDRLAVASQLSSAGSFRPALELTSVLLDEARIAGRLDLEARGLGLQGMLMAKTGEVEAGWESAQKGLSLALDHDATGAAAEVYQRLASVGEQGSEYDVSVEVYREAFSYCSTHEEGTMGNLCLACLAVVLRQIGDWEEAEDLCATVLQAEEQEDSAVAVASTVLGLIEAAKGRVASAQRLLMQGVAVAKYRNLASCEILGIWGLAIASAAEGDHPEAMSHCRAIVDRWSETEDLHYAISPLRWACSLLTVAGDDEGARACADALSRIASIGKQEALAALAHALAELALLDGKVDQAIHQFQQALELLKDLDVPYDRAATKLRLGAAMIEADQREAGLDQLIQSYRMARGLDALDLMEGVTRTMEEIGEKIEEHLGSRAAHKARHAGLTKRQMEVLSLVAEGMTNREVAEELVLSTRTVDMHVGNILDRLDSRSRTEAVRKATEQGLLGEIS